MAKTETRNYPQPQDKLFAAALKAVRDLGYKISNLDKANGLLNFKTDVTWKSWVGQEMSILIVDNGDQTCSVDIFAGGNTDGQAKTFEGVAQMAILRVSNSHAAAGIVTKIFERIEEQVQPRSDLNHREAYDYYSLNDEYQKLVVVIEITITRHDNDVDILVEAPRAESLFEFLCAHGFASTFPQDAVFSATRLRCLADGRVIRQSEVAVQKLSLIDSRKTVEAVGEVWLRSPT